MPKTKATSQDIRVLIADDHSEQREGLARVLELEDGIKVVAVLSSGSELTKAVDQHRPDVVVLDIDIAGVDSIAATRAIKSQFPSKVILTSGFVENVDRGPLYVIADLRAGSDDLLFKPYDSREVIPSIRRVHGEFQLIRVLIADDYPGAIGNLVKLLEFQEDIEVADTLSSGKDLLQAVEQCKPDVVLLDIDMAGVDSVFATRVIKERHPSTCVILTSIDAEDANHSLLARADAAGADDLLIKPFGGWELAASIRRSVYTLNQAVG
jgi:DNA-binding NarL/FixJ family response regulator